jgi:hypothetical protein
VRNVNYIANMPLQEYDMKDLYCFEASICPVHILKCYFEISFGFFNIILSLRPSLLTFLPSGRRVSVISSQRASVASYS